MSKAPFTSPRSKALTKVLLNHYRLKPNGIIHEQHNPSANMFDWLSSCDPAAMQCMIEFRSTGTMVSGVIRL
jgi:hypothetical protein